MTEDSTTASTPLVPVNQPPQAMLDLAEAAMARGFEHVSLEFTGLGASFPAPIEWCLVLERLSPETVFVQTGEQPGLEASRYDWLTVTASLQDEPTAYVGGRIGEDGDDTGPYWSVEQVRSWIDEDRDGVPQPSEEERAALLAEWPLLHDACLMGWAAKRELRRADRLLWQQSIDRMRSERGAESAVVTEAERRTAPLRSVLGVTGANWFYNVEGHPFHRSTGAALSVTARMSSSIAEDGVAPLDEYSTLRMEQRRTSDQTTSSSLQHAGRGEFEALARSTPPWFVPLASYDDGLDENDDDSDEGGWVLPPEATAWRSEGSKS